MRTLRLAAAVFTLIAGSVIAIASPAEARPAVTAEWSTSLASEVDFANPGTPPADVVDAAYCSSYDSFAHACFQRHGDVIWVDNNGGENVYVYWSNWLRDPSGTWIRYRTGRCYSGNQGWGYCNKDFYEDSSYNAEHGYGSGLRVYTCYGDDTCNANYQWVRNNE